MLDVSLRTSIPDQVWSGLSVTTPESDGLGDPFGLSGGLSKTVSRSHDRTPVSGRGIVYRGDQALGVVMRDISYKGVGLVSPQQVFPLEKLTILLHKEVRLEGVLRRCRRLGEQRYMCGIVFKPEALSTPQFRKIQQLLEA